MMKLAMKRSVFAGAFFLLVMIPCLCAAATGVTLTSDLPSPQDAGVPVTFTAVGAGGSGSYEFQFSLQIGGTWSVVQSYSLADSWIWNTYNVDPALSYAIQVEIRDAGTTVSADASFSMPFVITGTAIPLDANGIVCGGDINGDGMTTPPDELQNCVDIAGTPACPVGLLTCNTNSNAPLCPGGFGAMDYVRDLCVDTPTPVCGANFIFDPALQKCVQTAGLCVSPGSLNGATDRCEHTASIACVPPYVLDESEMICRMSPSCADPAATFDMIRDQCEKDPAWTCSNPAYSYVAADGNCQAAPVCPGAPATQFDGTKDACVEAYTAVCPSGMNFLAGVGCVADPVCPPPSTLVNDRCQAPIDESCPSGMVREGGICWETVSCPDPSVWSSQYDTCLTPPVSQNCEPGFSYDATVEGGACVQNPTCVNPGAIFSGTTDRCEMPARNECPTPGFTINNLVNPAVCEIAATCPAGSSIAFTGTEYRCEMPIGSCPVPGTTWDPVLNACVSSADPCAAFPGTVLDPATDLCTKPADAACPSPFVWSTTNLRCEMPVACPGGAGTFDVVRGACVSAVTGITNYNCSPGYIYDGSGACSAAGACSDPQGILDPLSGRCFSTHTFNCPSGTAPVPAVAPSTIPTCEAAPDCNAATPGTYYDAGGDTCSAGATGVCNPGWGLNAASNTCWTSESCNDGGVLDPATGLCRAPYVNQCDADMIFTGGVCVQPALCDAPALISSASDVCYTPATYNCPSAAYSYLVAAGECSTGGSCAAGPTAMISGVNDRCEAPLVLGCPDPSLSIDPVGYVCQKPPVCAEPTANYSITADKCVAPETKECPTPGYAYQVSLDICTHTVDCQDPLATFIGGAVDQCQMPAVPDCGPSMTWDGTRCSNTASCQNPGTLSSQTNFCESLPAKSCGTSTPYGITTYTYNLDYSTDGGGSWTVVASVVDSAHYVWTPPSVSVDTAAILRLTTMRGATLENVYSVNITILAPGIPGTPGSVKFPVAGARLLAGQTYPLSWETNPAADHYMVSVSLDGRATWNWMMKVNDPAPVNLKPQSDQAGPVSAEVLLKSEDSGGNPLLDSFQIVNLYRSIDPLLASPGQIFIPENGGYVLAGSANTISWAQFLPVCEKAPECSNDPAFIYNNTSAYDPALDACTEDTLFDCPPNFAYQATPSGLCEAPPTCADPLVAYDPVADVCPAASSCPAGPAYPCLDYGSGVEQCSPYECVDMAIDTTPDTTVDNTGLQNDGAVDPNTGECLGVVKLFKGKPMECLPSGYKTLWFNCCNPDPGSFLFIQKSCPAESYEVALARQAGLVIEVGEYCKKKVFLLGCVQKGKVFCKFNSKMGKIVQLNRGQLAAFQPGGGWGTPQAPNCVGLSPEQFQAMNLDGVDWSEMFGDITPAPSSTILPAIEGTINDFNSNLR